MDWLDFLAVHGTLKSLLQHHSSKALILQCSAFFIDQLSHPYMTTGKTLALTRWTFVGQVVSVGLLSYVWPFVTPWTIAHQAPLSMEFFRQEYWSGLTFPSPGTLSDPGIEPGSPALQADALPSEPPWKPPVGKIMFLLFNMLSRLVITFFPKEQASFNYMAGWPKSSFRFL